jgi:hypothetical protein
MKLIQIFLCLILLLFSPGIIVKYTVEVPKSVSATVNAKMNSIGTAGNVVDNSIKNNLGTAYSVTPSEITTDIVIPVVPTEVKNIPSPTFGPMRGGTVLTITGRDFVASSHGAFAKCRFDTTPVSVVQAIYVSSVTMKCTTPLSLSPGQVTVSVSMNGQQYNDARQFLFTYYAPPVIQKLSEVYMPMISNHIYVYGSFFDTGVAKIVYDIDTESTLCAYCVNGTTPNKAVNSLMYCSNCTEPRCGDLFCDTSNGETCVSCTEDCGKCTSSLCGDHQCSHSETCSSCPSDCGECNGAMQCGNGRCDINEHCGTCQQDCGSCSNIESYCGDNICNSIFETCLSCPYDCANGICAADETCKTCPADCDNCWPSQNQYSFNCVHMNSSVLSCQLPSVVAREIYHVRVSIDTANDLPPYYSRIKTAASVAFYEPYNVTQISPLLSPLSGGTIFDVVGKNFDFYGREKTKGNCKMGTANAVASPYMWYRNIHVSNLGSVALLKYQVLVEFNSKAMISAGQLRRYKYFFIAILFKYMLSNLTIFLVIFFSKLSCGLSLILSKNRLIIFLSDCEDMELRSADGTFIMSDIYAWLDRSSCNLEQTFLWIKIPSLAAGKTLRLRLISGSGVAKKIPTMNKPKDVFETFDSFEETNTILFQHNPNVPANYTNGGLEFYATSNLPQPSSKRRVSRFSKPVQRPYVIETVGAISSCTSHMIYAADSILATPMNASFVFDWRCTSKASSASHADKPCTTPVSGVTTNLVRRMTISVSKGVNSYVKALDNMCSPIQISNITDKIEDYVYFGSNISTVASRFEWIGIRKYADIEPVVKVGGVLRQVTEFVCEFPAFSTSLSLSEEAASSTKNNLTIYQAGRTWPEWKEERNSLYLQRYTEVNIQAIAPSTITADYVSPIKLTFATETLVNDMSVAVEIENSLMINCSIYEGSRTGYCNPPPYGVDKGFPPLQGVVLPVLVSSNNQQFVNSGGTILYNTVGNCAVISTDSFEDEFLSFQFGFEKVSIHGIKSTDCGAFAGTKALLFKSIETGERYARTLPFDSRCGMDIEFYLKIGNYDGCTISTKNQVVELQYSTDEGSTWFRLSDNSVYKDRDYASWTKVTPKFPKEAQSSRTILRWYSNPKALGSTPINHIIWALDLVKIEARLCSSAQELIFAGSSVVPASGPITGGTSVTIQGDFAKAVGKAVQCKFGTLTAADITQVTATSITCISPQQSQVGYVPVSLAICGSTQTVSSTQFYYYNKPIIQVYSPSSIPTSGGKFRFVLQSDFNWFNTNEAVVKFLHNPSSFSIQTSGNLIAVDELLAEQPRGSSYRDQGFPWSTSAERVRFQSAYTWLQLKAAGMNAGDVITQISVLPAECPTLDVETFRISILMRDGDPTDQLPVNFADGLYMNSDPPTVILGPTTIAASSCVPNKWLSLTLDTPFTLEDNKALLIEFSEENTAASLLTGNNIHLGLTMRHTFSPQSIRWHGAAIGQWPYVASSIDITDNQQLDQRLPCLKLCKATGCPVIVTVTAVMADFSAKIDPLTELSQFQVGIALNGQQTEIFPLTVYRPMLTLLNIQPPLGPSAGGTSIRIVPGDFSSGATSVVAIFTQAGNPSSLISDSTAEISVVKYYTACTSSIFNENTVFDCKSTPKASPGEYQVYVALNAASFDAEGVSFYYYPPMTVGAITPFQGLASGGEKITISGSGFMTLPSVDLIYCRFGRACFTGENDCAADSLQVSYTLAVAEGVEVKSKAKLIDANTIECEAPARPLGNWEIFVSNNGQNFEPSDAVGGLVTYTSRPCGEGREAFEYYDACVQCRAGFFDSDAERPNRIGETTDTVYPIQCSQCPIGQFQEEIGQLQCNNCPAGTSTLATVDGRIVQIAAASSRINDCTCLNKALSPDGVSSF